MDSQILTYIGIDPGYIIGGVSLLIIILLITVIVILIKLRNLNKKYNSFMRGSNAKSLEEAFKKKFSEVDFLKESDAINKNSIKDIRENLLSTYQKVGIEKYDAFKEMGGKLSFAIALLDNKNNGFVLNSMHNREGCYTYVKEIIKGESFIVLSEEEKKALEKAHKSNCYTE